MPTRSHQPDHVLIFDLKGPMAHFRKFYSSTGASLSYYFPPRTVVAGLIAGLLGIESERFVNGYDKTYYERFSEDNCFIALSMRSKVRVIVQTVNFIWTKSFTQIDGSAGKPAQIPMEILVPKEGETIIYRIYFSHKDENIYNQLKDRLEGNNFVFPPYLGISEFLGSIFFVDEGEISACKRDIVTFSSVAKLETIDLDFSASEVQYMADKMPTGFKYDRTPLKTKDYVFERNYLSFKGKMKNGHTHFEVIYRENNETKNECIIPM